MNWWIWIAAGILLAICEVIFMPGVFVLLFFGISACLIGLLLGVGIPLVSWLQVLLFAVLAVLLIVAFRSRAQRMLGMKASRLDFDAIVGEVARAGEEIAAGATGKVEHRGSSWNALNTGTRALSKGEQCRIVGMKGLQLEVAEAEE